MLKEGIPVGRLFGISIRLHYSWFVIFALVIWALSRDYFPAVYPHWSAAIAVSAGIVTSLLFFISLLAHELMHSLVAQRYGIPVRAITLFIFGGVSQITEEPHDARTEFSIAFVGPLTSIILGGIFWGLWYLLPPAFDVIAAVSFWLGWINILLAVFNLVPGFPLDGGRVLRSIIWWRTGNLRRATRIASRKVRTESLAFPSAPVFTVMVRVVVAGPVWAPDHDAVAISNAASRIRPTGTIVAILHVRFMKGSSSKKSG